MSGWKRKLATAGLAVAALGLTAGAAKADSISMGLDIGLEEDNPTLGVRPGWNGTEYSEDGGYWSDEPIAGGIWVDDGGDVRSTLGGSVAGTPLEAGTLSANGINGHIAAIWQFEVGGSSGDNWDQVLAPGSSWQFDLSWQGSVLNDNVGPDGDGNIQTIAMEEVFFSHIGTQADTFGNWVLNNNSSETPGAVLDPVWTYFDIEGALDPLTGSIGTFAVVAADPGDEMGLFTNPIGGDTDGTYAMAVAPGGNGELVATPTPTAAVAGLAAFGMLGMRFRRPSRVAAETA